MALLTLSLLALAPAAFVSAQAPTTTSLEPLASKHFPQPSDLPYQVTGDNGGIRGPQYGFNLCNSTTQNQDSNCQTMYVNSIDDWCMWSSPTDNDTIGESEAYEVAWCMKATHGTRVIPPGAITGLQFLYAKSYVQIVGFLDQTQVNLWAGDEGGELDPHGADEQGNPLGGELYTTAFGTTADTYDTQLTSGAAALTNYTQVVEWIDFIGGGYFCIKACNPSNPQAPELCNHIYDEIGCNYNALADYGAINGTYTVCDSDDMTPPGVYTDAPGVTTTWYQPLNGPLGTIPYTTTIPASSNCHTYSSEQLFATSSATPTGSGASTTPTGTGSKGTGSTASRSGSNPSATGSASAGSPAAPLGGAPFFGIAVATLIALFSAILLL